MVTLQNIKLSFITAQLLTDTPQGLCDVINAQALWIKSNIQNIGDD
jgi:hypothetical protein